MRKLTFAGVVIAIWIVILVIVILAISSCVPTHTQEQMNHVTNTMIEPRTLTVRTIVPFQDKDLTLACIWSVKTNTLTCGDLMDAIDMIVPRPQQKFY